LLAQFLLLYQFAGQRRYCLSFPARSFAGCFAANGKLVIHHVSFFARKKP
jgi:hypothetical protein